MPATTQHATIPHAAKTTSQRLLSLDFLRGLIMVLLILDSTGLYEYLYDHTEGRWFHPIITQFVHHPWHGLRFWDLIQPNFMFMAGTAMAFSLTRQWSQGVSWNATFRKVLRRSFWLFFFGVLDYAVRPHGLSFELWDVLTQLSFTTLVAFLVFRWPTYAQILVCAGLLLLTEVLYRYTHVPNFDQPFVDQHNFGNYVDVLLMNKINPGGWVAINCIPTAVHTVAGAIAGKLLINGKDKVKTMMLWAGICLLLGYGLDIAGVTPIIKRIATSTFTLASLGWCLLFLSFAYWWVDVKNHRNRLKFFTIVGMNSIFIYVFFEIVGGRWLNDYLRAISNGLLVWTNIDEVIKFVIAALLIFFVEWYLCYFLYKKKIFFKL